LCRDEADEGAEEEEEEEEEDEEREDGFGERARQGRKEEVGWVCGDVEQNKAAFFRARALSCNTSAVFLFCWIDSEPSASYACVYVFMYFGVYACMHACMFVCERSHVCVHMYVCSQP